MKSVSIGTPGPSRSKHDESGGRQAGFTLVEALVALSLLIAFAAALGPLMFHARKILVQGDGQVRAQLLLRSLLQEPFDRANPPEEGVREGSADDLRWRLDVEPIAGTTSSAGPSDPTQKTLPIQWSLFRVTAHVYWGAGAAVQAETLRLGRAS
jgi:type II secretory pathway pseudopilin PulG